MPTVCAIVVTYNRQKLLAVELSALLHQSHSLGAIYIVDNDSTDNTVNYLLEKHFIQKLPKQSSEDKEYISEIKDSNNNTIQVYYLRKHQNDGGSGGFGVGMEMAYAKNYDYYWLMDDDVEPDDHCLEELLKYVSPNTILMPLRIHDGKIVDSTFLKFNVENLRLPCNYAINDIYTLKIFH